MLNWSISFGENTTFTKQAKQLIDENPTMIKSVAQVQESKTFHYQPLPLEQLTISLSEIETIKQKLLPNYQEVSRLAETFYP